MTAQYKLGKELEFSQRILRIVNDCLRFWSSASYFLFSGTSRFPRSSWCSRRNRRTGKPPLKKCQARKSEDDVSYEIQQKRESFLSSFRDQWVKLGRMVPKGRKVYR